MKLLPKRAWLVVAVGVVLAGCGGMSQEERDAYDNGYSFAQSLNDGFTPAVQIINLCKNIIEVARSSGQGVEASYLDDEIAAFERGCEDGTGGDELGLGGSGEESGGSPTGPEPESSGADVLMPTTGTGEPFSAAPRAISVGNSAVWDIEWENWGASEVIGRGTTLLETCDPNCAEGKTEEVEVTLRVSDIGECNGVRIYLQLKFGENEPSIANPDFGCAY